MAGLIAVVPTDKWHRLATAGVAATCAPEQVLMRQGDDADHVVVILHGRVKVSRVDPGGNTVVLAVRNGGELIGELGLIDPDHRRTATVTAIDHCSVRKIPVGEFWALGRELGLQARLLEHISRRLDEAEELRTELSVLKSGPRVARCLLRMAVPPGQHAAGVVGVGAGRPIDVGLNQTEVAQAAGLNRSTVAGELRRLRDDGIVVTERGRIVIVDIDELRKRANE
jgi:CRP/FNR family cyclic AMP-dependent transcriptional regulator